MGAAAFSKPIAKLYSTSLATSVVLSQWKKAWICPIPKIKNHTDNSHFRPISITSVLVRVMERMVVRKYLYPALNTPPTTLTFHDQYAFLSTQKLLQKCVILIGFSTISHVIRIRTSYFPQSPQLQKTIISATQTQQDAPTTHHASSWL